MNRILIFITSFLLGATLYSCKEEPVGQTATDSTPPGKITNPTVVALPGGARISYTLPKDNDLLYVKAVYNINGVEKTDAATLYTNSVEVMGFGSTNEQTVRLYCVDRSGNQSEAVEVKFHPDIPPVTLIRESMTMLGGFGGVKIEWKNESMTPVAIFVLAADSIGDIQVADVIYTSMADGSFKLRGFDVTERLFGAYVRDRWDNYSDTLKGTFKPYFEEPLDKGKFKENPLFSDNHSVYIGWGLPRMWDNDISTLWHSDARADVTIPFTFTLDLGVTAKLSRFTLWQRLNFEYQIHNLRKFKVYGAAELRSSTDEEYWREGWKNDWFLLSDCEVIKPSGSGDQITQEDLDAAYLGHEFDVSMDASPVRYVRIHVERTWNGPVQYVNVAELSFWGEINKK